MDAVLEPLLRVSLPSARMNRMFSKLPATSPILFVSAKGDDRWDFVYSAVCYLAWPRKINRVELGPNESFKDNIASEVAGIFCGTAPPDETPASVRIGPNLVVVAPIVPQ